LSWFNDKIKRGLEGRKQSLEIVKSKIKNKDNVLWMHAASLGEYEQGLPVLEKLKEKYKDSARKSLLEYLGKLRDITKKLIDFKNQYTSVSDKLSDEEKMKLQLQNAHLISEYQKNLNEFLFISPIYSKKIYEILKDSKDDFDFAQKNGSIEIVVFSSVKTMGELFVEYTEEEIANDLTKSIYGLTIEEAEKKLQEFKNHFERK
jgi:3-deoxy-D-manno-octulosonic-acid transferase